MVISDAYIEENLNMVHKLKLLCWGIVGATLATHVIDDAYTLGMYKACHKWGKNYSSVKKACKVTGHW
ncbi:hypothetical protein M3576_07065 [Weizmannia ginsengihumi]|nr:hypothetical protein [Heyndrickxia ginsengihumi]